MPSDAKKKQQQKKKEAAKARQTGKKPAQAGQKSEENGEVEKTLAGKGENGTNGAPLSAEGNQLKITIFGYFYFFSFLPNAKICIL